MAQIILNTTAENLQTKHHFKNKNADLGAAKKTKEFGPAIGREPDFAELHALFEIQYKQFLTDTSDEIAKRAQRLLELESIVYGNPHPNRSVPE